MKPVVSVLAFAFATLLLPVPDGYADEALPGVAEASAESQFDVSITMSPIHLILPMGEFTAEYRAIDKLGVALLLGIGQGSAEVDKGTGPTTETFALIEVGAQARYYPVGNFEHGMQLGVEVLYLYANGEVDNVAAAGEGLALGPFIGYKIATDLGFTFDAQAGAQYMAMRASATDGTNTESKQASDIVPLINLNIGWSF